MSDKITRPNVPTMIIILAFAAFLAWIWREQPQQPQKQTVLNLDEMARKWNATSPYFLSTTNKVWLQETSDNGVSTIRIDPK